MTVTAEQITALRKRVQDADRRHAAAVERLTVAREAAAKLETRMSLEYGCVTVEALDAKIAADEAEADALYRQALASVAAAEAAVPR